MSDASDDMNTLIVFDVCKAEGIEEFIDEDQIDEIIEVEEADIKNDEYDDDTFSETMDAECLDGFEELVEQSQSSKYERDAKIKQDVDRPDTEAESTESADERPKRALRARPKKKKVVIKKPKPKQTKSKVSKAAADDVERLLANEKHRLEQPNHEKSNRKAPPRYLLFDELVATIVDYDETDTPIVQFAMATDEDHDLPVECGICPEVMDKSKLSKHLKTHRVVSGTPGTNRYGCIYCSETYRDYKYLAGHARRHMGIRPYVCEPCKLYFSTKQDMRVHNQRRHQVKEHICEVCGKTFSQNTMLKRHRESTHEKKLRHKCPHCPKAYYKNFALQEHIRNVHMGQRRMLTCPFCGMQCRDAHKMARHRRALHLNQTHYSCFICQEQFTDINYFDAHKRSIQCRNNTKAHLEMQKQEEEVSQAAQVDDDEDFEVTEEFAEEQVLDESLDSAETYQDDSVEYEPQSILPDDQEAHEEHHDGELVYEIVLDA